MSSHQNDIGGLIHLGRANGHGKSLREGLLRSVGERLAWLRRRAGLTLMGAAQRADISKTELSRLERDERKITLSHIRHLARAYGVTVSSIADLLEAETVSSTDGMLVGDAIGSGNQAVEPVPKRSIPLFDADFITREGLSSGGSREIALSSHIQASPVAYAIRFDGGYSEPWIPPGGILIADPSQSVRIYDLVVNTVNWSPTILSVVRLDDGRVAGISGEKLVLGQGTSIPSFHRILALIFQPEIWGIEIHPFRSIPSQVN